MQSVCVPPGCQTIFPKKLFTRHCPSQPSNGPYCIYSLGGPTSLAWHFKMPSDWPHNSPCKTKHLVCSHFSVLSTYSFIHNMPSPQLLGNASALLLSISLILKNPAFHPTFPGIPPWDFSFSSPLAELTVSSFLSRHHYAIKGFWLLLWVLTCVTLQI